MKNVSTVIPCYAADTSGVCSALYELGGLTVVHDASGCNSTYSTHDEPRWYDKRSMIYISALTEMDAVMGNDEKLILDTVAAAEDLRPEFITLCGSPMPMMTGFDYDAAAAEIEERSGIKCLPMHTNGTRSYIEGASEAFLAAVKAFAKEGPKVENGVAVLGATPLDFGLSGSIGSIRTWLGERGFETVSCLAVDSSFKDLERAALAKVSLVVSQSGLAAAKYLEKEFGIPYICGVPYGKKYAERVERYLRWAMEDNETDWVDERSGRDFDTVVIGETVSAFSLCSALYWDLGIDAAAICPLPYEEGRLGRDLAMSAEEDIKAFLEECRPARVIADPLYRYVVPKDTRLTELPHFAFSGRCFGQRIPDLINKDIKEFFE